MPARTLGNGDRPIYILTLQFFVDDNGKDWTMICDETLQIVRRIAEGLRQQGERDRAIEALVDAARGAVLPSLDLLTGTEAGQLPGVSG